MQLLEYAKDTFRRHGIKPLKRLGQSFMVSKPALERLVEYGEVKSCDTVLEVGAGLGFLTQFLAERAGRVLAVEKDPKLTAILRERFAKEDKVKVYGNNFLVLNLKGYYNKVISNPPYALVSKIIFKLLDEGFDLAVLTLQEEFANRLAAEAGKKAYGRLSVMTYVRAEVELVEKLPASVFYPKPKVDSVVVRLRCRKNPPFTVRYWWDFEQTVRYLFTQRNRKVRNALETLAKANLAPQLVKPYRGIPFLERRVFTLTPEELGELTDEIYA